MNETRNVFNCDSKAVIVGHRMVRENGRTKLHAVYHFTHAPEKQYTMYVDSFDKITFV